MTDAWNPDQYGRFRAERSQPFYDLLDLVSATPDARVVDLGCGSGELTSVLHDRLGAKETLGLDSSASMLARAPASRIGPRFEQGDIADFDRPGWDVIFSNAALHWLPDHARLFERLRRLLRPGGQLAVQMPANNDHPSHVIAAALAAEEPFRGALAGYHREWPVLTPEAYSALLFRLGFTFQHVRLQVYAHVLESRGEVVEWVKGTLLTDYERRLPTELFAQFLARYRERLMDTLPDDRPFLYPFKRILLRGRLPSA